MRGSDRAWGVVSAVAHAGTLIAVVWQYLARPYRMDDSAERIAPLDPSLWPIGIIPVLAGLAGIAMFQAVRATGAADEFRVAVGYAISKAVFVLPLAWLLLRQRVLNPEFVRDVGGFTTDPAVVHTGLAGILVALSALAVVRRFLAVMAQPGDSGIPARTR